MSSTTSPASSTCEDKVFDHEALRQREFHHLPSDDISPSHTPYEQMNTNNAVESYHDQHVPSKENRQDLSIPQVPEVSSHIAGQIQPPPRTKPPSSRHTSQQQQHQENLQHQHAFRKLKSRRSVNLPISNRFGENDRFAGEDSGYFFGHNVVSNVDYENGMPPTGVFVKQNPSSIFDHVPLNHSGHFGQWAGHNQPGASHQIHNHQPSDSSSPNPQPYSHENIIYDHRVQYKHSHAIPRHSVNVIRHASVDYLKSQQKLELEDYYKDDRSHAAWETSSAASSSSFTVSPHDPQQLQAQNKMRLPTPSYYHQQHHSQPPSDLYPPTAENPTLQTSSGRIKPKELGDDGHIATSSRGTLMSPIERSADFTTIRRNLSSSTSERVTSKSSSSPSSQSSRSTPSSPGVSSHGDGNSDMSVDIEDNLRQQVYQRYQPSVDGIKRKDASSLTYQHNRADSQLGYQTQESSDAYYEDALEYGDEGSGCERVNVDATSNHSNHSTAVASSAGKGTLYGDDGHHNYSKSLEWGEGSPGSHQQRRIGSDRLVGDYTQAVKKDMTGNPRFRSRSQSPERSASNVSSTTEQVPDEHFYGPHLAPGNPSQRNHASKGRDSGSKSFRSQQQYRPLSQLTNIHGPQAPAANQQIHTNRYGPAGPQMPVDYWNQTRQQTPAFDSNFEVFPSSRSTASSGSSSSAAATAASLLASEYPSWMLVQQNNQEMLVFLKSTDPRAKIDKRYAAGARADTPMHLEEALRGERMETESVSSGRSSKASVKVIGQGSTSSSRSVVF
jgi:hypothetical protein